VTNVYRDERWEMEAEHMGVRRAFVMTRQPFEDVEPGADEGLVKLFDLGDA
jgi:hypothetical protein